MGARPKGWIGPERRRKVRIEQINSIMRDRPDDWHDSGDWCDMAIERLVLLEERLGAVSVLLGRSECWLSANYVAGKLVFTPEQATVIMEIEAALVKKGAIKTP